MREFEQGDPVELRGHWGFEDDVTGTVWGPLKVVNTLQGPKDTYFVEFEEPRDARSGDGPYRGAWIGSDCIRHLYEVWWKETQEGQQTDGPE